MKNFNVQPRTSFGASFKQAGLLSILWFCALAQAQPTRQDVLGVAGERSQSVQVLGERLGAVQSVSPTQVRLVFLRPDGADRLDGSVGVFVNDRFHTSLVAGGYSEICLPPQQVDVGVRQVRVGERAKDPLNAISTLNPQGGQTIYLRVVEARGRAALQVVNDSQLAQQLGGLREQIQAVSRVSDAVPCVMQAAATPSQLPATETMALATETMVLATDVLFAFGRSDLQGMTEQGFTAIDQLTQRMRSDYSRVDRIHIIGHADPLGSPAANQRLSEERAALVRFYIARRIGANGTTKITSEGRGSRDPVERSCSRVVNQQSQSCNQPNRRVEVEVTGLRRP